MSVKEVVQEELGLVTSGITRLTEHFFRQSHIRSSKGLDLAVRIDSNPPSLMNIDVKTTQGNPVAYQLLSIPPYLLYNLEVILAAL